jgi:alpha-L-rhamnosidase
MISRLFIILFFLLACPLYAENLSPVKVASLTCEHQMNPIGIGARSPRLSWKLVSDRTGEVQTAYQITAASSTPVDIAKPDMWDSGKIASDQSVLIPWAGKPLASGSQIFWKVRVWDKDGVPSAWSDEASFELGLLSSATEWKGQWITADLPRFAAARPTIADASWITALPEAKQTAAFRRVIDLPPDAKIRSAVFDISAEGGFTLYVNGRQARQAPNRPNGWKKPTRADFGKSLSPGKNILAIAAPAAGKNGLIAHAIIELDSGARIEINTDASWKALPNPPDSWRSADFSDADWPAATVLGTYGAPPWGDYVTANTTGPGRYLRKTFALKGPIAKARLYSTALGVYEASVNGRSTSDSLLAPGWTDYTRRVMVQTADVTPLLNPGQNTIAAIIADGWYAGRLGWMGLAQYGTRPVFGAQLHITYADGSTDFIATDNSWKTGPGEIIGSDQQWGELVDARKAILAWNMPSFNDSTWADAVVEQHTISLDPQLGPPVRKLLELAPQKISRLGDAWIVDFGQNMVGHVRLAARGPAGTTVTLRHGETLNPDGSLYTANLRPAKATDTFILKGDSSTETFEPKFTFHGFRYVEITGLPGPLNADDLRGIVVGSDTPQTGTCDCSNPDVNRLFQNILWSQRGNFLSVPTDCPQRDERMGWMGDAQVFAPTAAYNADVAAFFAKWLVDVDDGQGPNGDFCDVSPRINRPQPGWPAWADAGVICPWIMYSTYGDKEFLAAHYQAMVRWVEYCRRNSADFLRPAMGVGDHLNPGSRTPLDVVATAYFAHSADLVAKSAAILGKSEDAAVYDKLFHGIAAAFNRAYVAPDGAIKGDTQTAYILALQFDLLPENLRPAAARRLAQDVEKRGHLTTGFIGVGYICPTLSQVNRSDLAWQLLLTESYPSWIFPVKNGATTIWERWDGWTPDSGFQDPAMNSFNHYSLGSVGAWLYSGAAGIQPDESHPGYKHFFLKPQFTPRLSFFKAAFDSPYGLITSYWHAEKDQLLYDVTIPPNSSAQLILPVPPQNLLESGKPVSAKDDAVTNLNLPAGAYRFSFLKDLIK